MWDYTDKVREHFINPRNVGELANANAVGEVGSLACGDALKLYLLIENDIIVDAKFQTFGCASAIASSSALTEMIKGKTIDEALGVTNKEIAAFLGGLPQQKMHCSVMGQEALEAAIRNYRGEPAIPHSHEGKMVCKCFGVTDEQIKKAIQENNLTTVEEVTNYTKAGGGCGDCIDEIFNILQEELSQKSPNKKLNPIVVEPKKNHVMSNLERMQKVMNVIDEVIKPRLNQDGGDIDLVDINGTTVYVALRGNCTNCPSSKLTVEGFIQKTLQDQVDENINVQEVNS